MCYNKSDSFKYNDKALLTERGAQFIEKISSFLLLLAFTGLLAVLLIKIDHIEKMIKQQDEQDVVRVLDKTK
jgi:hypothetical protein